MGRKFLIKTAFKFALYGLYAFSKAVLKVQKMITLLDLPVVLSDVYTYQKSQEGLKMTRKELAHRLAEHLETTPVYLAAPSFAYQVGDYTVYRHGSILDSQGQVVELEELLEGGSKEEMELKL